MQQIYRFLSFIIITSFLFNISSCEKHKDKVPRRESESQSVYIPNPVDKKVKPSHPTKPEVHDIIVQNHPKTFEDTTKVIPENTRALTIRFDLQDKTLRAPARLMFGDKEVAVIKSPHARVRVPEETNGQTLSLITPYYHPIADFTLNSTQKELKFQLNPLLVKLKVSDSLALHSENLDGVRIYYNGEPETKTIKNGLAEVNIAYLGKNEFMFYKPHTFNKQNKIINIEDPEQIYSVQLFPFKHFVRVKLINESGKLMRDSQVEISGDGVGISGTSDTHGIVVFKNFRLKPDTEYKLYFPNLGVSIEKFKFSKSQWDATNSFVQVMVHELYPWVITASTAGTELQLFNSMGQLIARGTDRLELRLKAGTYKIKAKSSDTQKEDIINASSRPRTKTIIMGDCYEMAQQWKSTHPEESIPTDIISCMKDIPTSDPNFVNSRMMLAKEAMEGKIYTAAKKYYKELFEYDRTLRFNPVVLCNAAQANIFLADNYNDARKEQLLNSALNDYLSYVSAYINKIPMKSRKRWLMKSKYLQGEAYQRLFFYYKKLNSLSNAKQNRTKALDLFKEFTYDYQAMQPGDPLVKEMKMEYGRANDLIGAISATPI